MSLAPTAKKIVYACPVDHHNSIIFITSWFHSKEAHTSLLLVPDFSESIEACAEFASRLALPGIHVYLYNQREKSFSIREKDLLQVAAWVRHREEGVSPVLLSKGLGALLCLYFSMQYPKFCRGLFCIDPISYAKFLFPGHRELLLFLAELIPQMRVPAWINCLRAENHQKSSPIFFQTLLDLLPARVSQQRMEHAINTHCPLHVLTSKNFQDPLEFFREEVLSWIVETFSTKIKHE